MKQRRRYLRLRGRSARDIEREIDDEIASHIELRTDEMVRRGEDPVRARADAVRRFGDLEDARRRLRSSARERERRLRRRAGFGSLRMDVVLALRRAAASPGYTILSIVTLALGIGLTTAAFTVVDRVLIRGLPFAQPDRLVAVMGVDSVGQPVTRVSSDSWLRWRAENRTLAASAIHMSRRWAIAPEASALRVAGELVGPGFFEVLRPRMAAGRPFTEEELGAGDPVVVVGEGLWRTLLGARALPLELEVEGRRQQVIGVVAEGQEYPGGTQLWVGHSPRAYGGGAFNNINWSGIARLAPGVSLAQAQADLSGIARAVREQTPEAIYSFGAYVRPLRDEVVGDVDRALVLLLGAVLFLLLIGCANLAGLSFARASTRTQEVAIRLALGAGRGRVLRETLTEHVLLALVGGAFGALLAWGALRLVVYHGAQHLPRSHEVALDARVLAFTFGISLLSGVLAGMAPALRTSGVSLRSVIGDARGSVHGGRNLPGALIVGLEVALALLLVTGGVLMLRSFEQLVGRELGFRPGNVITAEVVLTTPRWSEEQQRVRFWQDLLAALGREPGVEAVAAGNWIPTGGGGTGFIEVEGVADTRAGAGYRVVSEDYFRALGVPVVAGRTFERTDAEGTERVALINRAMAERYWPGDDPVGRRVKALSMEGAYHPDGAAPWLRVIGVVGDVRHYGYDAEPTPEMYVLYRQVPPWATSMTAVLRASGDVPLSRLTGALRARVAELDPLLAVEIATLEDRLSGTVAARTFVTTLLGAFALLALLLAAIGLYGLLSFAVARRTREIGVRTALGADRRGIIRLVLIAALRVVAAGAAVGFLAALWSTRLLESLLVDVAPTDPLTYLLSAVLLTAVTVAAAAIPAHRAARLDPLTALRTG